MSLAAETSRPGAGSWVPVIPWGAAALLLCLLPFVLASGAGLWLIASLTGAVILLLVITKIYEPITNFLCFATM